MNNQERGCQTKKPYLTEIGALVVARKREASGAPALRAYRCQYCGFFHLTKAPERQGTTRSARSAGAT